MQMQSQLKILMEDYCHDPFCYADVELIECSYIEGFDRTYDGITEFLVLFGAMEFRFRILAKFRRSGFNFFFFFFLENNYFVNFFVDLI